MRLECFLLLAELRKRFDNCNRNQRNEEPSPMWIRESDRCVQLNWIAIFSYTASLAVSLAIWTGVYRAIELLVK